MRDERADAARGGRYGAAIDGFDRAAALGLRDADLFNRAHVLVRLERVADARRDLQEALRVAPDDWEHRETARRQLEELRKD